MSTSKRPGPLVAVMIREARQRKGISLREAAAIAGVSFTTLAHLHGGHARNQPSITVVHKIARALDIPADTLTIAVGLLPDDIAQAMRQDPSIVDDWRKIMQKRGLKTAA